MLLGIRVDGLRLWRLLHAPTHVRISIGIPLSIWHVLLLRWASERIAWTVTCTTAVWRIVRPSTGRISLSSIVAVAIVIIIGISADGIQIRSEW